MKSNKSVVVRFTASLVYCIIAPFVLLVRTITDLNSFSFKVAYATHEAFGGEDPEVVEVTLYVLGLLLGATVFLFFFCLWLQAYVALHQVGA